MAPLAFAGQEALRTGDLVLQAQGLEVAAKFDLSYLEVVNRSQYFLCRC